MVCGGRWGWCRGASGAGKDTTRASTPGCLPFCPGYRGCRRLTESPPIRQRFVILLHLPSCIYLLPHFLLHSNHYSFLINSSFIFSQFRISILSVSSLLFVSLCLSLFISGCSIIKRYMFHKDMTRHDRLGGPGSPILVLPTYGKKTLHFWGNTVVTFV